MKTQKIVIAASCFCLMMAFAGNGVAADSTIIGKVKGLFSSNSAEHKDVPITEIVDETQEVNAELEELKVDYVLKTTQKYNKLVDSMNKEIMAKDWFIFEKDDAERFEIYFENIKEIRDFYRDIVKRNKNGKLEKELRSYITTINTFARLIPEKITREEHYKQNLELKIQNLVEPDKYRLETTRKRLNLEVKGSAQRIKMLKNFNDNYKKIQLTLKVMNRSIDNFIFTIVESSYVYDDHYNTLKLAKDISGIYRTLDQLESLDTISQEIVQHWDVLDSLVTSLTAQAAELTESTGS